VTPTIFGPVPSRRLGRSLGVDPVPFKVCNYNCVYCQLGHTRPLRNERRDYLPPDKILAELEQTLGTIEDGALDTITIVGQGEPLLCASLGRLVNRIKELTSVPVAVITNGSLLCDPQAQQEVLAADYVLPSLDAADEATFRAVNRPWPGITIAKVIAGLAQFRKQFKGQLWVEVMLVRGLNDHEEALAGLRDALAEIGPDQVQINLPVRPPAEPWVKPPPDFDIIRAIAILGEKVCVVSPCAGTFQLASTAPLGESIENVIRRHPMCEAEIYTALQDRPPGEVASALTELAELGRAARVEYGGKAFWRHTGAR
jgi:wyosine [tRNA(Phe)-imidazoG37] synthetase (radical SAM superfamily)